MNTRTFAFCAAALAAVTAAPTAHANEAWDLEVARSNARAGGPVSEHDAYLLDRYGALSGTRGFSPGGTYRLDGYKNRRRYGWRKRRY